METDFKNRFLYSPTGYIKCLNSYKVVKSPFQVPKDDLLENYAEATEEEYLDYRHFLRIRERTRRESISRNKGEHND